ncbi:MAG: LuxR C-terminal-related transcriptional regulator [Coriobacteriales bacterium]
MAFEERDLPESTEHLDPSSEVLHDVHMSMRTESFRVAIADADQLFVESFTALIREWSEFKLVGKAYTLEDTCHMCARARPEAVMMAATFKGVGCAPTIKKMLELDPKLRIFVLASMGESGHVLDALRAGASGFGSRDEMSSSRLRSMLWAQACGDIAFSGSLGTILQGALLGGSHVTDADSATAEDIKKLSNREKRVLALLEDGLSNAEISRQLFLSEPTVKKVIGSIIEKLHVSNRTQAAVLSAKLGRSEYLTEEEQS